MKLAMMRLRNLGWLALVCLTAILLYPLSLNVAATHGELVEIDREIVETRKEIDFLEAELRTRASMTQLEEWNDLLYGYKPPTARQFVDGEQALARLGNPKREKSPVLVAVANGNILPAGIIGSGRPTAEAGEKPLDDTEAAVMRPSAPREEIVGNDESRTERLAKMDQQLLGDDVLKDIDKTARQEKKGR